MSSQAIRVRLKGKTGLECSLPSGKTMLLDGNGPKPLEGMFACLGGCAGLTLMALAEKMRIAFDKVEIEVEPVLAEGKVHYMEAAHIRYRLWGTGLVPEQVERLIEMTERYCPVYHTLSSAGPIDSTYEINPQASS